MRSCYKLLNFIETVEESTCYMLKALFYENQKLDMVGHNDRRKWPLTGHTGFLNGQWPMTSSYFEPYTYILYGYVLLQWLSQSELLQLAYFHSSAVSKHQGMSSANPNLLILPQPRK